MPNLNEVFKTNGIPSITFVPPKEFTRLMANLQTPGRALIIEGPSGIGKTTAVEKAIQESSLRGAVTKLSARRAADLEYIDMLPTMRDPGTIIIDDFHKLGASTKQKIADFVKLSADVENEQAKIIIIGINNAGQNLIDFAPDLVNRIDVIEFEQNPDEKIVELIEKGSKALNVKFNHPEDVVQFSHGSFYLCQMLCYELCLSQEILTSPENEIEITTSIEKVRSDVWARLSKSFSDPCQKFCRGNRFRRTGRAPYFHILKSLAQSGAWLLKVKDYERQNPNMRNSINEVITKGHLGNLIAEDESLSKILHYDAASQTLIVEDPQFVFYIQNLSWKTFADELGFTNIEIERRYDFALSFAGSDRDVAEAIFNELSSREFEVFYDKNEQSRMLANDVETYLDPIYRSEAKFVLCVLGPDYPKRVWTRFEQKAFRDRIGNGEVVPILVDSTSPDSFSELDKIGHHSIRRVNLDSDVEALCSLLDQKLNDAAPIKVTSGTQGELL